MCTPPRPSWAKLCIAPGWSPSRPQTCLATVSPGGLTASLATTTLWDCLGRRLSVPIGTKDGAAGLPRSACSRTSTLCTGRLRPYREQVSPALGSGRHNPTYPAKHETGAHTSSAMASTFFRRVPRVMEAGGAYGLSRRTVVWQTGFGGQWRARTRYSVAFSAIVDDWVRLEAYITSGYC